MNVIVRFRRNPGAAENMLVRGLGGGVRKQMRASSRWMSLSLPASVVARLAEHSLLDFVAADEPVAASLDIARQASNQAPVDVPHSAFNRAAVTHPQIAPGVARHLALIHIGRLRPAYT